MLGWWRWCYLVVVIGRKIWSLGLVLLLVKWCGVSCFFLFYIWFWVCCFLGKRFYLDWCFKCYVFMSYYCFLAGVFFGLWVRFFLLSVLVYRMGRAIFVFFWRVRRFESKGRMRLIVIFFGWGLVNFFGWGRKRCSGVNRFFLL